MIDSLYFGKDDAESDMARGGLLAKSFLETSQYKDALIGRKWLILGRKGSGKSAICLKLASDLVGQASLITPDEISGEEIKRFELGGILSFQSKELLWRYIFCIQVGKFLLKEVKSRQLKSAKARSLLKEIRHFLKESGETEDNSNIDRFWKVIEKIKISLKVKEVEVGGELEMASGVRAGEKIKTVEAKLKELANEINTNTCDPLKFYLLIDQVERVWSNDPGSDALVIGLLRAAKHVQSVYDFGNVLVFMRVDIYEKLVFPERDKLRGDELHIRWDADDLIALIEKRALASVGEAIEKSILWGQVFPSRVADQHIKKFLASRTLNRPRDIIQLANACRDMAKAKGRNSIKNWDILAASAQYSRWKLVDIQNEWFINYPFLVDALLLLSNGSYLVSRSDFDTKYKLVGKDFFLRYPASASLLSSDYLLSILFMVGVVGVVRQGKTIYSCFSNGDDRVHAADKEFVIHPCFRDALQCLSAINLRPFEQDPMDVEIALTRIGRGLSSYEESISDRAYGSLQLESVFKRLKSSLSEITHICRNKGRDTTKRHGD